MTQPRDPLGRLGTERAEAAARIADLQRELAGIAEATAAGPDDEHDAEGSTVGFERARVAFLLSQATERFAAIERALAEVAAGRYGRCERCGEPVGDERLQALPTTRRCFRCTSEH